VHDMIPVLVAAGAMTLTLYCGHLLVLSTGVLNDAPETLIVGAIALAVGWQRWLEQASLKRLVVATAGRARRAVTVRAGAGGPR
jgi:hypothetical protein